MASYIFIYSRAQQKVFDLSSPMIRKTPAFIIAKGNKIEGIEAEE